MKILHVTHGYFPETSGGIESYLRMTMAAQRAAGDEVLLLAGSMELRDQCSLETDVVAGVEVHRIRRDDWYFDHYARSYHAGVSVLVAELLARIQPDLVHVHQWIRLTSDLVAIARRTDIPTVVTLHDVYTSCPRAFRVHRDGQPCFRELSVENCLTCVPRFGHETEQEITTGIDLFRDQYRSELEMADLVLVGMSVTADLLAQTTGLSRDRLVVHDLPYAPRFSGLASRGDARGDGVFRFGYWGSLTPHKGTRVLLDAFRSVVERATSPIELHLLGPMATEQLENDLHDRARGLPVVFHGPFEAEDLRTADLDVGVFPVLCFEGFGLGLAECFELGLPAIVSDIGALAERIGDAGLRVPPGDVPALATAMLRMATDAELRRTSSSGIAALPPTPEQHIVDLRGKYQEVLAAQRHPIRTIAAERRTRYEQLQRESLAAELREVRGRRDPR